MWLSIQMLLYSAGKKGLSPTPISTLNGQLFFHGSSFKYFWHAKNLIHGFERVIIAGTDMMDGFYDDWIPNKLIDIGEIALSSGAKAVVFGFSIAIQNQQFKDSHHLK